MHEHADHPAAPTAPVAPGRALANAARWERIRSLFHDAVNLEPAAASMLLRERCGDDIELHREVEALLADARRAAAHGLLERPTAPAVHSTSMRVSPPSDPEERAGSVIGAYRLLDVLGEGGFGIVYRAQQLEPVRRQVAVKIIKLGMDTRQVIQRFEGERQTLALMDHPGIARVLDAGATSTGRPYFVMELVAGVPITEHCDRARLSIEDRVKLLAQVCRAVQHAHQKGIIHRDIKPSNVLVATIGGEATPKVIDFGIAKATGSEQSERTVLTEFRQLIGTPEYMSPEQAGIPTLDVDTRSDIYSLGVLLYELLTGVTPLDSRRLRSGGPGEMQRMILEEEPPRPSARVSLMMRLSHQEGAAPAARIAEHRSLAPAALSRRLHGDLDWIACKALEKDRSRRYATALELAIDLERHLDQRPVDARPPSATYRVRKFVRRNRLAVASTAAIAALSMVTAVAAANLASQWERTKELEGKLQAEQAREGDGLDPLEDRLVMARLAGTRVQGRLGEMPLAEALDLIAIQAGVPIQVDWRALEDSGVTRTTPITLELDGLRAEAALDAALGQVAADPLRRPQRAVADGAVIVSSIDRLSRATTFTVYDVRDLAPDEAAVASLRELVTSLVDPESWQDNGGDTGRMQTLGGSLIVATTRENHRAIRALLAQVRRPGTPGEDQDAARASVAAAAAGAVASAAADSDTARRLADTTVRLDPGGAALGDIIARVRDAANVPINVDWGGFAATGVDAATPIAIEADGIPADLLLKLALRQASAEPAGSHALRAEVVDGAILISAEERLDALRRVVAHDIAPLAAIIAAGGPDTDGAATQAAPLARLVQSTIDPDGWVDNGGDRARLFVLGERLVVSAAPGVQRQVRALLAALVGARPPSRSDTAGRDDFDRRAAALERLESATITLEPGSTVASALEAIARSAGVGLHVDWAALDAMDIRRDALLDDGLRAAGGRRALEAVLRSARGGGEHEVGCEIVDGTLLLGARRGDGHPTMVIDVGTLLAGIPGNSDASPPDQLVQVLVRTIAPDRWVDNGGVEGRMHVLGDRLVVSAPTPMIVDVQRLLAALAKPE